MSTSVTFNSYESDDRRHLLENFHYLSDRRCFKSRSPIPSSSSSSSTCHPPLTLRRSVSLEDTSTDVAGTTFLSKSSECSSSHLLVPSAPNPTLSSSLNNLCLRLRRHQLLPEYNEDIARSSDENHFNWWKTAATLRPIFEKLIMNDYRTPDPLTSASNDEQLKESFQRSRRRGRRNAVCLGIDRLYYNEQLILFATIANEVQLEFNLMFSGFKE